MIALLLAAAAIISPHTLTVSRDLQPAIDRQLAARPKYRAGKRLIVIPPHVYDGDRPLQMPKGVFFFDGNSQNGAAFDCYRSPGQETMVKAAHRRGHHIMGVGCFLIEQPK